MSAIQFLEGHILLLLFYMTRRTIDVDALSIITLSLSLAILSVTMVDTLLYRINTNHPLGVSHAYLGN